jgi:hypothetical protein
MKENPTINGDVATYVMYAYNQRTAEQLHGAIQFHVSGNPYYHDLKLVNVKLERDLENPWLNKVILEFRGCEQFPSSSLKSFFDNMAMVYGKDRPGGMDEIIYMGCPWTFFAGRKDLFCGAKTKTLPLRYAFVHQNR